MQIKLTWKLASASSPDKCSKDNLSSLFPALDPLGQFSSPRKEKTRNFIDFPSGFLTFPAVYNWLSFKLVLLSRVGSSIY